MNFPGRSAICLMRIGCLILALMPLGFTAVLGKPSANKGVGEETRGLRAYRDAAREPELTSAELNLLDKAETMAEADLGSARIMLEGIADNAEVPTNPVFQHALGNIYVRLGKAAQAEKQFESAIKGFPNFQRAWNDLGTLRYVNNDFAGAAEALAKSIELGSGDSQTYGALAYCQSQLGSFEAAEMSYNLALVTDANNADWLEGKAQVLMEMGKESEAVRVLRELLRRDPGKIDYWLLQANNWLAAGEPLKAARSLEIARDFGKLDAEAVFLLGNIYLNAGLVDKAVGEFRAIIESGGEIRPLIALRVARRLLREDRIDDARALFAKTGGVGAGWESGDRVRFAVMQADLAIASGNTEAALGGLEDALKIDPLSSQLLVKLAGLYAGAEERAKAYYLLERLPEDAEGRHQALVLKSQLLVEDEQFREAERALRQALAIRTSEALTVFYDQVNAIAKAAERH